jgi:hypothetical protein
MLLKIYLFVFLGRHASHHTLRGERLIRISSRESSLVERGRNSQILSRNPVRPSQEYKSGVLIILPFYYFILHFLHLVPADKDSFTLLTIW